MTRALRFAVFGLLSLVLLGQAEPPAEARPWFGRFSRQAVAADHPAASAAGAEILAAGGNAADAAAATMLALGVANPASSGMGGGGFLLYYRASDQSLTFLDFRERAPGASTADMYDDVPPPGPGVANSASQLGGLATGVPGEPAGVAKMVERFGSLPLSQIVEPARRLAADGFEVSAYLAHLTGPFGGQMRRDATMRGWFEGEATTLRAGQTLRRPELARTLVAFGRGGANAIYRGPIARALVRANRQNGGILTAEDLADYRVVEREPLSATHFGHRWVTAPPPSAGGFTMLSSLAVLEGIPERLRGAGAPWLHALAESWKGPFMDRQRYFGDPDHVELPLEQMLAERRVQARVRAFHPRLAMPPTDYELPLAPDEPEVRQPDNSGTAHLCVVDDEGNIAAITTTVNLPFGARYTAAGIVMNDEMDDFARSVGEANAFGLIGGANNLPGPGRRPVSTMSPTIIFDGQGRPVMCVGAAGGSRIVTAAQQVAMNALLFEMPLDDAVAAPRVHHQGMPNRLRTEEFAPLPEALIQQLRARGHHHQLIHNVAVVQAIRIRYGQDETTLEAASDPRKGGRPAGQ